MLTLFTYRRGLAGLLAITAALGCASPRDALEEITGRPDLGAAAAPSDGPGAQAEDAAALAGPDVLGATGADAPMPAVDAPGATPEAGAGCATGFHLCGTSCQNDREPAHCGVACEPCPGIQGGTATCDGTRCGVVCP